MENSYNFESLIKYRLYTLVINIDNNEKAHFIPEDKIWKEAIDSLAKIIPNLPPNEF